MQNKYSVNGGKGWQWVYLEQSLTGAQRGAGQFLYGLAVTGQPSVEGGRVGAAAGSLLEAPPTAAVARRPLRPCGPAAIHCDKRGHERTRAENNKVRLAAID